MTLPSGAGWSREKLALGIRVVVAALGLLAFLIPPIREGIAAAIGGAFALLVGVKAQRRRSSARDDATEATAEHREAVAVENAQTGQRQKRSDERVSEAAEEEPQTDTPTDEERARRVAALGTDPLG